MNMILLVPVLSHWVLFFTSIPLCLKIVKRLEMPDIVLSFCFRKDIVS